MVRVAWSLQVLLFAFILFCPSHILLTSPPLVPIILSISRTCPHIFVGGDPIFRASQTLLNFNRTFDCCLSTDQTLVERENSQLEVLQNVWFWYEQERNWVGRGGVYSSEKKTLFFWRPGLLACFPLTSKWGRGSGLDPVFLQLSKENWDCGSGSKLEGGSQTRSTGIIRSSGLRGKKAFVHLCANFLFHSVFATILQTSAHTMFNGGETRLEETQQHNFFSSKKWTREGFDWAI